MGRGCQELGGRRDPSSPPLGAHPPFLSAGQRRQGSCSRSVAPLPGGGTPRPPDLCRLRTESTAQPGSWGGPRDTDFTVPASTAGTELGGQAPKTSDPPHWGRGARSPLPLPFLGGILPFLGHSARCRGVLTEIAAAEVALEGPGAAAALRAGGARGRGGRGGLRLGAGSGGLPLAAPPGFRGEGLGGAAPVPQGVGGRKAVGGDAEIRHELDQQLRGAGDDGAGGDTGVRGARGGPGWVWGGPGWV